MAQGGRSMNDDRGERPDSPEATDGGPGARAVTAEWLVSVLRLGGLVSFAVLAWLVSPPGTLARLALGSLLVFGIGGEGLAAWALMTGRVRRELARYQALFLIGDLLLVAGLAYLSNLLQVGLLAFFLFLIVIVTLRAGFRGSLFLGPVVALAYLGSSLLRSGELGPQQQLLLILDALGMVALSFFCGWFTEGTTRAWRRVDLITRRLEGVNRQLHETRHQLQVFQAMHVSQKGLPSFMSHELRTPLTGIIGFTDLLLLEEAGPLLGRQREFLEVVLAKSEELVSRIDNILDIYRTQFGRMILHLERFTPEEMIDEVLAAVAPRAAKKGVELVRRKSEAGQLPAVTGDREKVKRSLYNLVDNALNNAPRGELVRVTVELGEDAALESRFPSLISSAQAIRISVTEDGPPPDVSLRPHLFDPFPSTGAGGAGTAPYHDNIGLAAAREIVGLHWGRMWFEETPEGNTIRFTLPVNPVRVRQKIALVSSTFSLEPLLEGLLVQLGEEIRQKKLTVRRQGWLSREEGATQVSADKQLLQSVLFNVLGNNIRYAFPGSEIIISLKRSAGAKRVIMHIENFGDNFDAQALDALLRGEEAPGDRLSDDVRQVNVNLALARDIIESHGGSFTLVNRGEQGVLVTIELPT
jgi:signal transduction histidine kinase